MFSTNAVGWEELKETKWKKTFETNGYSLSENATCRKKIDRWIIKDEGKFLSRKIYIVKKVGDNLNIYRDDLLSDIRDDLYSKIEHDIKESIGSISPIRVTLFFVFFCVLFFGVLNTVNPLTLFHNAEGYQKWCFVTVFMVYVIFFIPFYLLARDLLHLRIWANIAILLLTLFVAFFSLCKCWNCLFNESDAFFWVFSTLAQVYGALLGLLVLSVFFIAEQSNKESERRKNRWELYSTSAAMISLKCIASVLFYSIIILPSYNFFSVYSEIGVITIIIFGVVFPILAISSLIPLIGPIISLIKSRGGTLQ